MDTLAFAPSARAATPSIPARASTMDKLVIGKLFGETRTQEDKTDLLILVTPHIVDDGDALGAPGGGDR